MRCLEERVRSADRLFFRQTHLQLGSLMICISLTEVSPFHFLLIQALGMSLRGSGDLSTSDEQRSVASRADSTNIAVNHRKE